MARAWILSLIFQLNCGATSWSLVSTFLKKVPSTSKEFFPSTSKEWINIRNSWNIPLRAQSHAEKFSSFYIITVETAKNNFHIEFPGLAAARMTHSNSIPVF